MTLADLAPLAQGAGLIVAAAIGVLLWWLKEWRENRRAEAARRRRLAEVMVAVRAEILVTLERTALQFDPAVSAQFRTRLMEALRSRPDEAADEKRDMPQGVADEGNFVFDALKADLGILPEATIEPVVRHYRYDRMLSLLIGAFAAGAYERVSDERQSQAVGSLFWLGEDSLFAALQAVKAVDGYLVPTGTTATLFTKRFGAAEAALESRLSKARMARYTAPGAALSDEGNDGSEHHAISYPAGSYIVEMLRNGK